MAGFIEFRDWWTFLKGVLRCICVRAPRSHPAHAIPPQCFKRVKSHRDGAPRHAIPVTVVSFSPSCCCHGSKVPTITGMGVGDGKLYGVQAES